MSALEDFSRYSTLTKLHTADHLSYLRANQILREQGITMQQALILRFLFHSSLQGLKINQKDVEQYLGISNPSVTSLMKNMVAKKLISRLPDHSDARSYLLRLTPRGQQLQNAVSASLNQLYEEASSGLSEAELTQFNSLLDKITANLLRSAH